MFKKRLLRRWIVPGVTRAVHENKKYDQTRQTVLNPKKSRRCPTLPLGAPSSTIGTQGLSFRVRNGNGRFPFVMIAGNLKLICNRIRLIAISLFTTDAAFFVKKKLYGQASRAISTGKLNASRRFHTQPIKQVVYLCPSALAGGRSHLGACFPLICLQRLSLPDVATQRCPWRDNWRTRGPFVQVLSYYGPPPSNLLRLPWIGTELSRDVLNPAHVPL